MLNPNPPQPAEHPATLGNPRNPHSQPREVTLEHARIPLKIQKRWHTRSGYATALLKML